MEKFKIAQYGLMQVTAIVYGVLASGATVKFNRYWMDQGFAMPDSYYRAIFFRDYGFWLLPLVMIWTICISYFASHLAKSNFDDRLLAYSGMALTVIFAIVGTIFAAGGAIAPYHSTMMTPLQ